MNTLWLLSTLAGCGGILSDTGFVPPWQGGQSGSESVEECVRDSERIVSDSARPATGFAASIDDLLPGTVGSFDGVLDWEDGSSEALAVLAEADLGGAVAAFYTSKDPDQVCPCIYELALSTTVTATSLGGTLDGTLFLYDDGRAAWETRRGLEDLIAGQGPGSWDPVEVETSLLLETTSVGDGLFSGELTWLADADAEPAAEMSLQPRD